MLPPAEWPSRYTSLEQWHRQEIDAILGVGLATTSAAALPDLLRDIHRSLAATLDLHCFAVGLVDEAAGQLNFIAAWCGGQEQRYPPADLYLDTSAAGLVARSRQAIASLGPDPLTRPESLVPGLPLPAAYAALPLFGHGRVIGVLVAGDPAPGAYGQEALRLFNIVAGITAMALEQTRLYEAISRYTQSLEERVVMRTAELEGEKVLFESTVQSLSEGLVLCDLTQRVTLANNRAQILLGLPLEALLGHPAAQIWSHPDIHLEDASAVSREFQQALNTVETYPKLMATVLVPRLPDEDVGGLGSERRDLSLRLFPVRDRAGQMINSGLILQDITREREMDRMKDELVNVVSHELRTPMSSVLGFAELLLSRDFPEAKRRQIVETIHQEAERLSALINDFLDLRRLESGRQQLVTHEVRLGELVASVASTFILTQKQHALEVDVPADLPSVRADPERLGQALRNLLANAFKYSPDGGVVQVRAGLTPAGVQVLIIDHGLGLPAEVIPQLFQRFYRVDSSDRRQIGGTGLGLAIVKEIISAHGGRVWAESAGPGCGSTFGFVLPAPRQPETAAANWLRATPSGPYVLMVEADPGQVVLLREHLEPTGTAVLAAPLSAPVIEMVRQHRPVGVVLDVGGPEPQPAWDLLTRLRQAHSAELLPVVLTSTLDERERGQNLGATAFLTRPFDPRQLAALLTQRAQREVLVVDDEEMILRLMRSILVKSGYQVQAVNSGQDALACLARDWPDVLILDLMMPVMNGFELLEQVRALPRGKDLPAIVVTAKLLDRVDLEFLRQHGAFLLTKGDYTAVRLRAAVEHALRVRWAHKLEAVELQVR